MWAYVILNFSVQCMQIIQVNDVAALGTGSEDDVSIEQHIRTLQQECKKSMPNEHLLDDRMKRTLLQRREYIQSSRIEAVLEKYPALTYDCQVSLLFLLLHGKYFGIVFSDLQHLSS